VQRGRKAPPNAPVLLDRIQRGAIAFVADTLQELN
jgi:hypothetical protein